MITHQQMWRNLQRYAYNINPSPMAKLDWLAENGTEVSKEDALSAYDTLKTPFNVMLVYQELDLYKHIAGLGFTKDETLSFVRADRTVSVWLVPVTTLVAFGIGMRCLLPAAHPIDDVEDAWLVRQRKIDGDVGKTLLQSFRS